MRRVNVCGLSFISVAVLGMSVSPARADYTYTFDNSSSYTNISSGFNYNPTVPNFRFDYGSATPAANNSVAFSTVNAGAPSPAGSGSVELSSLFHDTDTNGTGQSAFTIDLFPSPSPTNITNVAFDIEVNSTSPTDSYGGVGYFTVTARDDSYNNNNLYSEELGNPTYSSPTFGTFEHISIPLSSQTNIRALTLSLYDAKPDRDINGTVSYELDNLVLSTPPVPEPATLSMLGVVLGGAMIRRNRKS